MRRQDRKEKMLEDGDGGKVGKKGWKKGRGGGEGRSLEKMRVNQ